MIHFVIIKHYFMSIQLLYTPQIYNFEKLLIYKSYLTTRKCDYAVLDVMNPK